MNRDFKKLAEVPVISETSEDAKVILEQDGEIYRGPAPKGKGGGVTWYSVASMGEYWSDPYSMVLLDKSDEAKEIYRMIIEDDPEYAEESLKMAAFIYRGSDVPSIYDYGLDEEGNVHRYTFDEDAEIAGLDEIIEAYNSGIIRIKWLNSEAVNAYTHMAAEPDYIVDDPYVTSTLEALNILGVNYPDYDEDIQVDAQIAEGLLTPIFTTSEYYEYPMSLYFGYPGLFRYTREGD